MLKQALLSTIFATATFGFAGAQSPQNEQTGPGAAGSSSPSESRPKQDDEAAPSRKGKAERESKPHKKGQDVKKERADTRNDEPTTRRDAGDAAEPVQDRAAKRKKREKERPANDEPPRVTGPSERETLRPATKTGESEARPAKGAETDSSGAKLEDGRQPAQNEDSGKSKDAEGPKPVQDRDRDAVTKDVPRQGEETAKSRRNVDRNEVDRRDSEQGPKSFDRPDQPEPRDIAEPTPNPRTAPEVKKQEVMPADEQKAKEVIREERVRADEEFEKAKERAKAAPAASTDSPRLDERAASKFEQVRKERRERVERGGVALIEEPDKRVIVREKDRAFIQHDEGERLRRSTKELRRERRSDGTTIVVNLGIGGVEITSIFNDEGQLLRRSRHERGREVVLIDNSDFYRRHRGQRFVNAYVDLPPLALNIPRAKYVVEYEDASEDEVYDALIAPPLERLDRGYSLEEVRQSYRLRERMRRVDLDAINFAFASWEVDANQYPKLERVADAIKRIIERNPDEVFMIEGHTDAVGSDIDNLSLSDRRAETVAIILSDTFRVPPENLVTQGYGEQFLKVETEAPSRENRRVAVRRVTPLLSRNQRQTRDQ